LYPLDDVGYISFHEERIFKPNGDKSRQQKKLLLLSRRRYVASL